MKILDKISYTLPVWAIAPLVNNDHTAISDYDYGILKFART